MFKRGIIYRATLAFLLLLSGCVTAFGQASAFSYQGQLTEGDNPADGLFDMQFRLFDTQPAGTGSQLASITQTVQVKGGVFIVQLDFGACANCFNGAARFLEIALRPAGSPDHYTALNPRQPITSAPYAVRSISANTADTALNAAQLGGQPASGFIQNTTTQQATTNFNIGGSGTVGGTLTGGVVNATTQYNIGGLRMLTANGPFDNGITISFAASNTFAGEGAGLNTTPDPSLVSGGGKLNSFFGAKAGFSNTSGFDNSFFGRSAGFSNTSGFENSFFGKNAGFLNTTGDNNSSFGSFAGSSNTTGNGNSFFGHAAGSGNQTGSQNTIIGFEANVGGNNLTNATAIGSRARINQSNSIVLGSISGVGTCVAANNCQSVNVGIGTTQPSATLHLVKDTSDIASPVAIIQSTGIHAPLAFRVDGPEVARIRADNLGNLVFVTLSGLSKNIVFRAGEDLGTDLIIQSTGNVGIGNSDPADKLDVEGDIRVGTSTTGCVKDADGTVIAGTCSSDARLKREITPFPMLLDKLVKLRPVHFYWRVKEHPSRSFGEAQSFGLIAQEVEQVMPELVTEDEQGFKAVNYSKLPLLMLQAIKELKAENDSLKLKLDQLSKQQDQIENLKKIVCLAHPHNEACK